MPSFDFKTVFMPTARLGADQYWLALGMVALIDTRRLSLVALGAVQTSFITLILLSFVHINRMRDAGRQLGLISVPLLLGLAGKIVAACVALFFAMLPILNAYLVERGVDINDPEAMNALAADPGFQTEFQAYVMNTPELAVELAQAMAWPSHWGFWIVVVLVGRWFARLPSRQG